MLTSDLPLSIQLPSGRGSSPHHPPAATCPGPGRAQVAGGNGRRAPKRAQNCPKSPKRAPGSPG
eukprot:9479768-Pyramimonas_sp.AAC.1